MPAVRVLIVDDHPVVRRGLRELLKTVDGIEPVGEAADGTSALREAQLLHPDVVIMDLRLPDVDGATVTERLRRAVPGAAVLVLTMYDDAAAVTTALQAGAAGYLLKGAEQDEIVAAIKAVATGATVLASPVAHQALRGDPPPCPPFPQLTPRERQILEHLASGHRTSDIARHLHLSPKTISNQLTSIFATLGVHNRAEAIIAARDAGLGTPP